MKKKNKKFLTRDESLILMQNDIKVSHLSLDNDKYFQSIESINEYDIDIILSNGVTKIKCTDDFFNNEKYQRGFFIWNSEEENLNEPEKFSSEEDEPYEVKEKSNLKINIGKIKFNELEIENIEFEFIGSELSEEAQFKLLEFLKNLY